MSKKTILFGAPNTFNISSQIVKNLEFLGFDVLDISYDQTYKYKNLRERSINFYRKLFLGDKNYKNILRFESLRRDFYSKIETAEKIDYALIIRPDIYPLDFIEYISGKVRNTAGYQWDGMSRFPFIKNYLPFFERFFVFDPADVSKDFLPVTNFYFDYSENSEAERPKTAYFIGSYFPKRAVMLDSFTEILEKNGYRCNISISTQKKRVKEKYRGRPLKIVTEKISYEQNLKNIAESSLLFDLGNGIHHGLSFRTFEALGSDKKLLTDNLSILQYDFYHPDNIFVLRDKNFEGLEEFLAKPYCIRKDLKRKYSFTNWIHYILDIRPHTEITLPEWT